jgi:hypothetical protein
LYQNGVCMDTLLQRWKHHDICILFYYPVLLLERDVDGICEARIGSLEIQEYSFFSQH